MKGLWAFSWGYWGWGTHASEFVDAADAIERSRGKRPPVFVDIRFSRSVRAPGFRGSAFETTVGKNRYQWLRKLGNERIGSGRSGLKIADPTGVEDLLQLITELDTQRRRAIFFCACEQPCHCHRREVARLLVGAASRQGVLLSVAEWPGGEPKTVKLVVEASVLKSILTGGNRVPLGELTQSDLRQFAQIPWASRVELHSGERRITIVSGPAQLGKFWYLPVIGPEQSSETDTVESLKKEASRLRKELGFLPLSSDPSRTA